VAGNDRHFRTVDPEELCKELEDCFVRRASRRRLRNADLKLLATIR
jgi:hypothetical protein